MECVGNCSLQTRIQLPEAVRAAGLSGERAPPRQGTVPGGGGEGAWSLSTLSRLDSDPFLKVFLFLFGLIFYSWRVVFIDLHVLALLSVLFLL